MLQIDDHRVNAIGFRLITANAPFCNERRPATGLLLADMATYRDPGAIRAAMGLKGDFAVQAVAPGSPAAEAGIVAGAELFTIDGTPPGALASFTPGGTGRLNALHERIESAVEGAGEVRLRLTDRTSALRGVTACHVHFELTTDGKGAQAGDGLVLVSRAMLSETRTDDEAAFVMAHETAHIVLGHQARRKAFGKARAVMLETEREADRIAVWLMTNAGYDPNVGPGFLRRYGAKGLASLFPGPYHDRAGVRATMVGGEIAAMRAATAGENSLKDWRVALRPRLLDRNIFR
ncbi:M48 family metalloprotease [Novosphingobium sp.]|uniref:M48 family metalloprotease n=1 Tax=Novosphingobium sp. TaxID=1874826 RepID=UPI00286DFB2F|nr:M48 family metalloprotease [Novosphingobium sp.]